ncbi:DgyrCDS9949 [Dimorphilus gyrociliatus]|uniref:Elongation factor 1-gamma n=1 Tax=Dimorphilus gyrociliatus TaxID=2664684 RepID=A0A7I8VYV1_9ANNE|nr:DgyrCDS9949 [Dimorphilus gyrociliatus]
MSCGTLYTYPENFRAFKALIAAEYSGSKITLKSDFVFGETNKSEAFLKKFPLGKVPAFEGNDGTLLFESNAIAYYVANELLRGANAADAAKVLQWVNFADSEILPAACDWTFPCLGIKQFNKTATDSAKQVIKAALSTLNSYLATRTYLVGERVTLADISVVCSMLLLYKLVLDPEFRQPYPHVNRWFTTCINQPSFKKVLGSVELCTKMAQFDAKKWAEFSGQGQKKDKPKKEQKQEPKAAKPKEAAAPAAEPEPEKKPVNKDPFSVCPPTNFNFDAFKKVYSNEDTITKAVPYFWEHFEPENMSIWYCEYKYPEDLTAVFMSCNLISGMFQRLEKLRKAAFGTVLLFGEANNSTISGIWFWRGQDLAFPVSLPTIQNVFSNYTI